MWIYDPKPVKLDPYKKNIVRERVEKFISSSERLSKIVNRVDIRGGRVYMYHLVEQRIPKGATGIHFIKPLIDGKYFEFPFARITLFNKEFSNCSVDWQRHNNQWMSLFNGTLDEGLQFIQEREEWFS